MATGKQGYALAFVTVIILLNLLTESALANTDKAWRLWKKQYGKKYGSKLEENIRRAIWEKHVDYIKEHNAKQTNFKLGMNHLGDQVIMWKKLGSLEHTSISHKQKVGDLPVKWDWREHGAVTSVKNQGASGSVVSFAAAACVESYHAIKTKHLLDLSIQQIQDCCPLNFEEIDKVFDCIKELGGLCLAKDYKSGSGGSCNMASCKPVAQIEGKKRVRAENETDLQISVLKTPVFALIDASRPSFMFYQSGVYDDEKCSSAILNHAVQVVGYGSAGGKEYWLCKNSWGPIWGMKGYIQIARNHGNRCGIATNATYPI